MTITSCSDARRRSLAIAAALATLTGATTTVAAGAGVRARAAEGAPRPNVLVIVTDDQRALGTLDVMPETHARFWAEGTSFPNAFATTPLCCPSRTSIFTGMYEHNHGVTSNAQATDLPQSATMQRHLHDAGYRTALVGKYLNGWPLTTAPPYFDRWATTAGGGYRDFKANVDGAVRVVSRYSTSFMGARSVDVLRDFEGADARPWFLYLAVNAPHAPREPSRRYADAPVPEWTPGPATAEADVADKPPFLVSKREPERVARTRAAQLRTLMSADDLVGRVFRTLDELDETSRTLAVFVSDNGFLWGEHGYQRKRLPYDESVRVPFALRWPGRVDAGAVDERLVANVDIAPTVLGAAGLPLPETVDGRTLLDGHARAHLLLEYRGKRRPIRSWASIRTHDYVFTQWFESGVVFREHYDLRTDPHELDNVLADDDPTNDPAVDTLADQMRRYRRCSGSTCP